MRTTLALALVLAALTLAACNTVAGAGKDVSAVGHAVTQTAKDASH
jgi:entericidin B